jgi:hypothetical protein
MQNKKKYIIVGTLVFLVIFGPMFLLSGTGLELVQEKINKNPKGESAPWFQFTLGKTYYYTLRPAEAARTFKTYVDRYAQKPDQRYWDARYYQALSLDEAGQPRPAAQLFREYYEECPDNDPHRAEVKKECLRLRHHLGGWYPTD